MKDRVISIVEYVLVFMYLQGGISIFFADPAILPGAFAILVGQLAVYGYGIWITGTGLALLYAKLRKKKKLHKHSLLSAYLICVYIGVLSVAVAGLDWGLIQIAVVGGITGWLWLRWKFKTEYIDPEEIRKQLREVE